MLRTFLDNIKSKPKNKFSLENLQLHTYFTYQNKNVIIETLRSIAEVMIWGDQHNPEFFEKEHLSLFFEDFTTEDKQTSQNSVDTDPKHSSGKHTDDEVLAYYISLLKTLSLKLNKNTLQFFFNESENDFPLYTEAIKFFNSKDSMIRIAVRTLTLNVYKVEDDCMRKYILDKTAAPYFSNIVWYIREQCTTLDTLVLNSTYKNKSKLDDFVAELLDYFYYLHDIFNLGINELSNVLSQHLLACILIPQFADSLLQIHNNTEDPLNPWVALFLLSQVFYIFSYKPLINNLASYLLDPVTPKDLPNLLSNTTLIKPKVRSTPNLVTLELNSPMRELHNILKDRAAINSRSKDSNLQFGSKYFHSLVNYLECKDDRMLLPVLCLLQSIIKNSSIDQAILESAGIYPYRLSKAKKLLEALTSQENNSSNNTVLPPITSISNRVIHHHQRSFSDSNIPEITISTTSSSTSSNSSDNSSNNKKIATSKDILSKLIYNLLCIYLHYDTCRLITLQLSSLITKELVYSHDSTPNLDSIHIQIIQDAYKTVSTQLLENLSGSLGDIFLELFEQELKSYKQLNFDSLLNDYTSLLLPVSNSSLSGQSLNKRLPSGLAEKIQRGIQAFLVIRELMFAIQSKKDHFLPIKEEVTSIKVKDTLEFDHYNIFTCSMLVGPSKKKLKRFFFVNASHLIICEPIPHAKIRQTTNFPESVSVCNVIPIDKIEIEEANDVTNDCKVVQLTNHIMPWNGTLLFDPEDNTNTVDCKQTLEQAKHYYRTSKLSQIQEMLTTSFDS